MYLESLIRSSYQKVIDAYIKFLQHPWPKRWPVKVDQLSNMDRLPFWTRLAIANSTIVFLFPGHLKERSLPIGKCFDKNCFNVPRIFNQAEPSCMFKRNRGNMVDCTESNPNNPQVLVQIIFYKLIFPKSIRIVGGLALHCIIKAQHSTFMF